MRNIKIMLNNLLNSRLSNKFLKKSDEVTLKRSTRVKKTTIPSDYVVYLQELDYNLGAENDPETFSQAMSFKESNLWHNAMKD